MSRANKVNDRRLDLLEIKLNISEATQFNTTYLSLGWAVRQIAVYKKCVDASFVLFCDLAFLVGRGLF